MTPQGSSFLAEWGRVGGHKSSGTYPISKWASKYKEKTRKGYVDHTDLMAQTVVDRVDSGNLDFDNFYDMISHYTGQVSERNYSIGSASPLQISEAQVLIDKLIRANKLEDCNRLLLEIFQLIPREMRNVNDYLLGDLNKKANNKCATQVGKIRARQLSQGKPISKETLVRMFSYLSRAQEYYDEGDTQACGTISYLLWGGKAGLRWATSKMRELDLLAEDLKEPCQKGYEMIGFKMKNGRRVPNCVPEE